MRIRIIIGPKLAKIFKTIYFEDEVDDSALCPFENHFSLREVHDRTKDVFLNSILISLVEK